MLIVLAVIEFHPLINSSECITNIVTSCGKLANMLDYTEKAIVALGSDITSLLKYSKLQLITNVLIFDG